MKSIDTLSYAQSLDKTDELAHYRSQFFIPKHNDKDMRYFCGNSLGLQHKGVKDQLTKELDIWAEQGVEGHFRNEYPWLSYHRQFSGLFSDIVGAKEEEVIIMNSLTTNLHLLMATFYRPTKGKFKIIIEKDVFPSDYFSVKSQAAFHQYKDAIIEISPRQGEYTMRTEDIIETITSNKEETALILLGGMNYITGQFLECETIAKTCQELGITFGLDLAHAVGNVPLALHNWGVDFAVWCNYKYINGGPGTVGGAFVHEKHHKNDDLPRFNGWWGTKESTRFMMEKKFESPYTAEAWQLSNAPIMTMASIKPTLLLFQEIGMEKLRKKSVSLTQYFYDLVSLLPTVTILTPSDQAQRGCQLSLFVPNLGKELEEKLREEGIIVDWRNYEGGGIIRVAPVPLYNTFEDVFIFVDTLKKLIA